MTPRLMQVWMYRRAGLTNKQIAQRLKIATDTVKAHVARLIRQGWRF